MEGRSPIPPPRHARDCRVATTLDAVWAAIPSVSLGEPSGEADGFVLVRDGGTPRLRLDIRCLSAEAWTRHREAAVWGDWIVAGFGCRVELVSLADGERRAIALSETQPPSGFDYFCRISVEGDVLLVASGTRVFRIGADGNVLWTSEAVGADGVLVHAVDALRVRGDGEWDPPGGWAPYELCLETGRAAFGWGAVLMRDGTDTGFDHRKSDDPATLLPGRG